MGNIFKQLHQLVKLADLKRWRLLTQYAWLGLGLIAVIIMLLLLLLGSSILSTNTAHSMPLSVVSVVGSEKSVVVPFYWAIIGTLSSLLALMTYLMRRSQVRVQQIEAQRQEAEAQLLHNALHDVLTGLPNRTLFLDRLERTILHNQQFPSHTFAVLFLDLDQFKVVNESLGHQAGDQLLQAIAQRLLTCLRPYDTLARLGGDEFAILLPILHNTQDALNVADRIQEQLKVPLRLEPQDVFISTSIGLILGTGNYRQPEHLLRDADTALYHAKRMGRACYQVFEPKMHTQAQKLLQIQTDLRRAVERQEFQVQYQPIISLKNGRLRSVEALIRWHHPTLKISPTEFIPVAEETGLIIPMGLWILRQSCQQMVEWQTYLQDAAPHTVSVNLSSKQFIQPNLIDQICQTLQETGLPAQCLRLELTESVLIDNTEAVASKLQQLSDLGIRISIDDFGTGYSSLSYLHRLPIDVLKVDRSFISRIDSDGEKLELVRTIVNLAWNLGMEVVAEGVETKKQLAQLKSLSCEYAQGYFFSRPVDSAVLTQLLKSQTAWGETDQAL